MSPRTKARAIVIAVLPCALVVTVVQRLYREIRTAFYYAWHDAQDEIASARRMWRGDLP